MVYSFQIWKGVSVYIFESGFSSYVHIFDQAQVGSHSGMPSTICSILQCYLHKAEAFLIRRHPLSVLAVLWCIHRPNVCKFWRIKEMNVLLSTIMRKTYDFLKITRHLGNSANLQLASGLGDTLGVWPISEKMPSILVYILCRLFRLSFRHRVRLWYTDCKSVCC